MNFSGWSPILIILAALALSACGSPQRDRSVVIVKPTVFKYSKTFQTRAAEELGLMPPPCDRQEPVDPCSAVKRGFIDHLTVRDQIRASQR